jgi:hypothetical protein
MYKKDKSKFKIPTIIKHVTSKVNDTCRAGTMTPKTPHRCQASTLEVTKLASSCVLRSHASPAESREREEQPHHQLPRQQAATPRGVDLCRYEGRGGDREGEHRRPPREEQPHRRGQLQSTTSASPSRGYSHARSRRRSQPKLATCPP